MKHISHILLMLIILTMFGCNKFGNPDNPLYGKIYRNVSELPGFTGTEQRGGFVIESSKDEDGNYKLGFTYFKYKDRYILMLEEISKPDEKGKVSYKILDTITVVNVKEDQYITHGNCGQGEDFNDKLVALVNPLENETFEGGAVKAWLINIETGRIDPLADTKGITCFYEDFSGCGDDDYEEGEIEDSLVSDTAVQAVIKDTVITQSADSVATKQ